MHILPNSKIPFSSLPLDVFISNKTAALRKRQEGANGEEGKKEVDSTVFTLDEFDFPHAVSIHESALKAEPLIATYKKLYLTLALDKHPGKPNLIHPL